MSIKLTNLVSRLLALDLNKHPDNENLNKDYDATLRTCGSCRANPNYNPPDNESVTGGGG